MGRNKPNFDSHLASVRNDGLEDAADNAVSDENDVGVFGVPVFCAGFMLLSVAVLCFEGVVVRLEIVGTHVQGGDHVGARFGGSGDGPLGQRRQ